MTDTPLEAAFEY